MKTPITKTCADIHNLISRKESHELLATEAMRAKKEAAAREADESRKKGIVSRELMDALERVARKYLRSNRFKLTHYNVRKNHHGRNHIVAHTDSLFIENESVNIPLEVLDWTEEQWAAHANSSETLDPVQIRLGKMKERIVSLQAALAKARNDYHDAESAIAANND